MGDRGPVNQPLALLKLKGTGNVTRMKEGMPLDLGYDFVYNQIQPAPEDMPPTGRDLWNRQLNQAQKIYGYISFIDLKLFEEYCHTYAMLHSIRGRLYNPPKKDYDPKNDWSNYHKLATRFDKLSQEFAFSPSARTRVKLADVPKNEEDEFDGVL